MIFRIAFRRRRIAVNFSRGEEFGERASRSTYGFFGFFGFLTAPSRLEAEFASYILCEYLTPFLGQDRFWRRAEYRSGPKLFPQKSDKQTYAVF